MRYLILAFLLLYEVQPFCMAPKVNLSKAIDNAILRYSLQKEPQLMQLFTKAGVSYPPKEIALLAFKKERHIQLWARANNKIWRHIHNYPLTAYSGHLGPKLKEHDKQIPEGIYHLTAFNPFSSWHLSMMIDYPNEFDRLKANKDGRKNLGDNIFLHGKSSSVGCLAVGDKAIDQLFLLVRRVGLNHTKVIIAPNDLRREKPATKSLSQPVWLPELYKDIKLALSHFPVPRKNDTKKAHRA